MQTAEAAGATAPIPFVLAIDIEPDGRAAGRRDPVRLEGFEATAAWLDDLRPRLEALTGRPVNVAWFLRMDPQIEELAGRATHVAERVATRLDEFRQGGDGIGLHTHAGRWDATGDRWIVDHGDPSWIEHCIRTSFDAYTAVFGHACAQHRFGDRWSSPRDLDLIAELGGRVDLSAEPGKRRERRVDLSVEATGMVPSYLHLRSVPARHRDPRLWLLPLTSGDPGPALSVARRVARRVRFLGQPRHRPLLLDRSWRSPAAYWSVMRHTLDGLPAPYVALAIRSDVSLRPAMAGVRAIFEALFADDLGPRLQFVDAVTAIGMLTSPEAEAEAEAEALFGA